MNKVNLSFFSVFVFTLITSGAYFFERADDSNPSYEYLSTELTTAKEFTLQVMENMPAEDYGFKPADEMRTFRAQAYHIAYSMEWFNGQLSGNRIAWEPGDEDEMSKEELMAYTTEQFDTFIKIIQNTEESGPFTTGILSTLRHNSHHRGQMVAYYRANGMTPPSYR